MGGVELGADEVAYGARVGFAAGNAHDLAQEVLEGGHFGEVAACWESAWAKGVMGCPRG